MDNTRLPPKRSKTFSGHDNSSSSPSSSTPLSSGGRLRHSTGDIASKDVANDLRRSTLIPENAANDANWFAKRGLMSRKSFKLHKKELKKKSKNDKKKKKKNTSRDDNGGAAEFSQSLNDIESSCSPSNKNRLLHNSMESLEEEEVDIFSKSLENTDMMMFSKSRQNDSAASLVSEEFRESVDSFRQSLDSGSGSGGSPPLSGGSEQSMPPSLATTDESGDKMSSPPRRRFGVISGDKDDLTLLSSRMRREEHDDESCENERAPSDSIDISGFRENMISNLDMEYTASSRTLQALHGQGESERNGSDKTKLAMKKQVSWKTDHLEVPKRTSSTTIGVSGIVEEEEVEYARNTVRESVATQVTGNMTAPQIIVDDGDDDDSLSLNWDILSNMKPPPPPPNDSSSLAILKGRFIQVSDTYDQRRPSLDVSALDMGFSSKTLQNKWLNNELSDIEDSNRSSTGLSDDDDNSINKPVSIQLQNDDLGHCLSSSLDIDSMNSESDDADSSSSDSNEDCADNIVPETHFDRNISDNSGDSKSILHSGKEHREPADRRHSTVSFCNTTKSGNFSTIDVATTVTGVSDLTGFTSADPNIDIPSCPPSFEEAENSARVKERRTSTLIPQKSSIDVSWFAQNRCMSKQSYKKYKQEMKDNMLNDLDDSRRNTDPTFNHSASLPSGFNHHQQQRGLSTSTYGTAISQQCQRASEELGYPLNRSSSMDTGRDLLKGSDDAKKNAEFAALLQSLLSQSAQLDPDEVQVLKNVVKRLSSADDDDSFFGKQPVPTVPVEDTVVHVEEIEASETLDNSDISKEVTIPPQSKRCSVVSAITENTAATNSMLTDLSEDSGPQSNRQQDFNFSAMSAYQIADISEKEEKKEEPSSSEQVRRRTTISTRAVSEPNKVTDCTPKSNMVDLLEDRYSDILTEGMNHLSKVMLVNIYGRLRELSVLGHTSSKLIDIDCNSHQSLMRNRELKRLGMLKPKDEFRPYVENTRTARFVVQHVLDEYEMLEMANQFSSFSYGKASLDYDAGLLRDFKTWVEESRKRNGRFTKGSVLRNLLDSGLEVVWMADRHPDDVIYCICIDRESTTVTVIFHDEESTWSRFKNSSMMDHHNPLSDEDYEGSTDFIPIRAAVSEEILRPRRDTGKTTIDEICEKVDKIGKELGNGGRYNLSITGHSKAGGLATVCGFYLAANASLQLTSAVRIFTFASSHVGGKAFHQSFKHLEETGRLLHARFTQSNEFDSLPLFAKGGGDQYTVSFIFIKYLCILSIWYTFLSFTHNIAIHHYLPFYFSMLE